MGLFDIFRRPAPIADRAALADFVDSRAAFLTQKCVFEYSRARAGILWQKLFKEEAFVAAVEAARWHNYPLGVAYVVRMAEATLRPADGATAAALVAGLAEVAAAVLARHGDAAVVADDDWQAAGAEIGQRLAQGLLAPVPAIKDIPLETARRFFARMPIHESLRGEDFELVQNHLRSNLCRIYEDFAARADRERLVRALVAPGSVTNTHGA
ncbi:MAG TPA: hypothetical protein PLJ34_09785 [Hyphomicrobiales bacterium]|nr:hypothetical protein [Kaistiaceae bacterium]HQF31723.1 hypothetical protein [Hyphomicrobiales bacterium]